MGKVTHGLTRGYRAPLAYSCWVEMNRRCYDPRRPAYARYGGRGITVCDRWRHDFSAFLADMGERLSRGHSIERIDNDGNYEPGNCRWATAAEQNANKGTAHRITINGESVSVAEWNRRKGMSRGGINARLRRGWSEYAAIMDLPPSRQARVRFCGL